MQAQALATRAQKLAKKYGIPLTLVQVQAGTFDPDQSRSQSTSSTFSLYGLVEGASGSTMGRLGGSASQTDSMRAEGPVRISNRKVTIAAADLPSTTPRAGDRIGPIEGRTWTITSVTPVQVNGTPISYELRVTS